jgi:hypothetical protein
MAFLFSASTCGFYNTEIHGKAIPKDAVRVSDKAHAELLHGQSGGLIISADANGRPTLKSPPPPTAEQLTLIARQRRDRLLRECDWAVMPDAPMERAARDAWTAYRQALRDVMSQPNFPQSIDWPAAPI